MSDFYDRCLGMDRPVTRRDFLNGAAVAIGATLVPRSLVGSTSQEEPQNRPGYDPPVEAGLRGSHPGSFEIAHSLRDGTFWDRAGKPSDTGESYDLVVVGGGISGLAAAYFFREKAGKSSRILILENHDDFGGHAKRNEFHLGGRLQLLNGGTLLIDSPTPYSPVADGLLKTLGIDPPQFDAKFTDRKLYRSLSLGSAVFFDKETFGEDRLVVGTPGRSWDEEASLDQKQRNSSGMKFLAKTPLSQRVQHDIARIEEAKTDYMPGLSSAEKKTQLVYEYNRNNVGEANDWFNKAAQVSSGLPNKPGQLIRNTFGATFGGPIKKDKLFFFLNYEGQKTQENQQQNLTVPTTAFKAGNVSYSCTGNVKCPSSGIQTLTPAQVASMDPNCTSTCPWGQGEDPNAIATLNQYPNPNTSGGDGLNTGGFTWSAPDPARLNTYIAKVDYQLTTGQRLFIRGNLQGDRSSLAPQFPGGPPSASLVSTSKGIALGHTWTISSTLINNFRYGYIRQSLNNVGAGNNSFSDFVGISPLTSENTTTLLNVPLHNFVDDFTWVRGKHTLQFGANYRLIHNNAASNSVSFNSATTGDANISQAQIAGTGQSFDPSRFGFPAADNITAYDNAITAIAGLLSTINVHNNYRVASASSATLLSTGATIPRGFKANEFEWYGQDSWRVKPNLTVTVGLRHTLLQTPYEVNGQQVAPTINLHQWFINRAVAAAQGTGNQPEFSFAPAGQGRGGQPFWPMNKLNFAPRLAIAYSPDSKTSIRMGAGLYYDHFGEGIVDGFSQFGSFGLTSTQAAPSNVLTPDDAPRYTGRTNVPPLTAPSATVTYPAFPPDDPNTTGFTFNSNGIDGRIKTPYSIATDLSVQRQIGKGWVFEVAYVGRFGRHLLQQLDLAAATDLVDSKSGMDYSTAARLMSEFALANGENPAAVIPTIPYFENLFPTAATGGASATQNIYTGDLGCSQNSCFSWATRPGREVGAPYRLGLLCTGVANGGFTPACNGTASAVPFWDPQFSSLFAWSSLGTSNYNAAQFMMRHTMSRGLQVDFSYTYSKSIDLGSDTERVNTQGTTSTTSAIPLGTSTVMSYIANPWNPALNRAPSDFDLRHVIAFDWAYELPFGRGKTFAGDAGTFLDSLIGGWQFAGLNRWSSAFPFSVIDNHGFTQNFLFNSNLVETGPIRSGLFMAGGSPYAFPGGGTINTNPVVAGVLPINGAPAALAPMRFAYPGEAGSRNNFRGQGYFGIDAGLAKSWRIREGMSLKFSWEVFNVTNSVRFDTNTNTSLDNGSDDGGFAFGLYRRTLSVPRVQQFSLRLTF